MKLIRREWPALALLVATPFVLHWPLVVPGAGRHYFVPGDFVDQFYAFASFAVREVAAGRLPLWNPHAYAGAPFWADVQAAVAYPPNLSVTLAAAKLWGRLPFGLLELQALVHMSVAGVLTYLFARRHLPVVTVGHQEVDGAASGLPASPSESNGNKGRAWQVGALVAALCFQLGGYLTGYPPLQLAILQTVTWLPLALVGVDWIVEAAEARGSASGPEGLIRGCLLAGTAWGLMLLAGHPQSAMLCLYLSLAYALWGLWPWRSQSAALRRGAGGIALALGLALGLSAAGWLPASELWRLSNRAAASYDALANGFPPRELAGILLAGLTHWFPLYVGVLPLLLAVAGGWLALRAPTSAMTGTGEEGVRRSDPRIAGAARGDARSFTRFWLGVLVVGMFLSLGRHSFVFDLAYLVAPGFNLFRGQERAALWVSFALAMLAGAGVRAFVAQRVVSIGAMVIAGVAVLLLVVAAADLRTAALRLLLSAGGAALVAAVWRSGMRTVVMTGKASPAASPAESQLGRRGGSEDGARLAMIVIVIFLDLVFGRRADEPVA